MNTEEIVQAIDAEIDRLQEVQALLLGDTAPQKRRQPIADGRAGRKISPEGRARIATAQRARRKRERGK